MAKVQNRSTKNDPVLEALPLACADEAAAVAFMELQRWGEHPACPRCGSLNVYQMRDSKTGEQTEMDPLLFDVLWHTMQITGYGGTVEVLSAFRSPETNAWLASVSRGVARDSQHMNGNAMDIRFPGVPVFKIRQAARSLQMGGVGFYPRSGFVHLDTGPVRYW